MCCVLRFLFVVLLDDFAFIKEAKVFSSVERNGMCVTFFFQMFADLCVCFSIFYQKLNTSVLKANLHGC